MTLEDLVGMSVFIRGDFGKGEAVRQEITGVGTHKGQAVLDYVENGYPRWAYEHQIGRFPVDMAHYTNAVKKIMAEYQQTISEENDHEHPDLFITFEAFGMHIVNPFVSSCSRFPVDPVEEYGDAYRNSDWFKGWRLQAVESYIVLSQ